MTLRIVLPFGYQSSLLYGHYMQCTNSATHVTCYLEILSTNFTQVLRNDKSTIWWRWKWVNIKLQPIIRETPCTPYGT